MNMTTESSAGQWLPRGLPPAKIAAAHLLVVLGTATEGLHSDDDQYLSPIDFPSLFWCDSPKKAAAICDVALSQTFRRVDPK